MAMMEAGMTQAEARQRIWMYDKHGLLIKVSVCFFADIDDHSTGYVCEASCLLTVWWAYYIEIDILLQQIYCMWLQDRPQEMDSNQEAFIHDSPGNVQSFLDAVNTIKPTAIIGKRVNLFLFVALTGESIYHYFKS